MAKIYWVDFPNPFAKEPEQDVWICVGTFNTRRKAEQFLEKYGIRKQYADLFISAGDDLRIGKEKKK